MIASELVLTRVAEGVGTITLNHAEKYNALSTAMISALSRALSCLNEDMTVRVIVIDAKGKAFCAGHDLKEMSAIEDQAGHKALFDQCGNMMMAITQGAKPVIAAVQGVATAAGCQLVAACDLAVASSEARFATSGINVGLFCSTPAVALSRNVARKRALELLFTGDFITADIACEWGLVNKVVLPEALHAATSALAKKIASKSAESIQLGKAMFYQQLGLSLDAAYDFAGERMACNMQWEDAQAGIDAFINKRNH